MAHARFAPCPHCQAPLSFLEGVSGSSLHPMCPRCRTEVSVPRATFLMIDHSMPKVTPIAGPKPPS